MASARCHYLGHSRPSVSHKETKLIPGPIYLYETCSTRSIGCSTQTNVKPRRNSRIRGRKILIVFVSVHVPPHCVTEHGTTRRKPSTLRTFPHVGNKRVGHGSSVLSSLRSVCLCHQSWSCDRADGLIYTCYKQTGAPWHIRAAVPQLDSRLGKRLWVCEHKEQAAR